ncbi:MAG: hypothetical protein HY658_10340 [Actinobacteria bacterium]|nr:hypothetical protein [Actinomycetota bacterium]
MAAAGEGRYPGTPSEKGVGIMAFEIGFEDVSAWWIPVVVLLGILVVGLVMWLLTTPYDRRMYYRAVERDRERAAVSNRLEEERIRRMEAARAAAAERAGVAAQPTEGAQAG